MNPYIPPTNNEEFELTKEQMRQYIINHPDAGPLAVLWAKYPIRSKLYVLGLFILVLVGILDLFFN